MGFVASFQEELTKVASRWREMMGSGDVSEKTRSRLRAMDDANIRRKLTELDHPAFRSAPPDATTVAQQLATRKYQAERLNLGSANIIKGYGGRVSRGPYTRIGATVNGVNLAATPEDTVRYLQRVSGTNRAGVNPPLIDAFVTRHEADEYRAIRKRVAKMPPERAAALERAFARMSSPKRAPSPLDMSAVRRFVHGPSTVWSHYTPEVVLGKGGRGGELELVSRLPPRDVKFVADLRGKSGETIGFDVAGVQYPYRKKALEPKVKQLYSATGKVLTRDPQAAHLLRNLLKKDETDVSGLLKYLVKKRLFNNLSSSGGRSPLPVTMRSGFGRAYDIARTFR